MSYSMDKTVYFSTLDQYKYNPAMIISGAEGDQVISAAPGIVKSIDVTAQTGTTVNVDLGNGYELPDDATEVGKASYVSDKKDELSDEFDTTLHRDRLTVYVSESNPDRVYLLEEDIFGELDVWIFALD